MVGGAGVQVQLHRGVEGGRHPQAEVPQGRVQGAQEEGALLRRLQQGQLRQEAVQG